MKDTFLPFGGGIKGESATLLLPALRGLIDGVVCIGMHLAYMELSLATAKFFRKLPNTKTWTLEEDMEFENYFVITPKSHKCEITST